MLENRSIPDAIVIPVLGYLDVDAAVVWLCEAFGFAERLRIGNRRAQLTLGTGALIVAERAGASATSVAGTQRADSGRATVSDSAAFAIVLEAGAQPVPLRVAEVHYLPSPATLRRARLEAAGAALLLVLLAVWVYRRPRTDRA